MEKAKKEITIAERLEGLKADLQKSSEQVSQWQTVAIKTEGAIEVLEQMKAEQVEGKS